MRLRRLSRQQAGCRVEVRQAYAEEIPFLRAQLKKTDGEQIDLDQARIWVAVHEGKIVGMLPARMMWQLEPLLIFPEYENPITRSRAGLLLYRAAEKWLGDRSQNRTGIHWFFAITRSKAVKGWAQRLGWFRQYRGAATYIKYL